MSASIPNATVPVAPITTTAPVVVLPVDPATVWSPKASITNVVIVHDGRPYADGPLANWSCCTCEWEGDPAVGLRWNGGEGQPCGMPQSRGIAIWFIVPDVLAPLVLRGVRQLLQEYGDPAKSLRSAVNELIHAARRATPEELARLQNALSA